MQTKTPVLLPEPRTSAKNVFIEGLIELARDRDDIVLLCGDLGKSTECWPFRDAYPNRYFNLGMAEQNMIGMAAGLAREGFTVFVHTFSVFLTRRCYDQVVISVGYGKLNVKLMGFLPGLATPGGVTHQAIDDLALMRVIPGMRVLEPADITEHRQLARLLVEHDGPCYVRTRRGEMPQLFDQNQHQLGFQNACVIRDGSDAFMIAAGMMTETALKAAELLEKQNLSVGVIHNPSIKPLDVQTLRQAATRTHRLITIDNHSLHGGLGSVIAEAVADHNIPTQMLRIGLPDQFGCSGSPAWLFQKYNLDAPGITNQVLRWFGHTQMKTNAPNDSASTKNSAGWTDQLT